MFDKNTSKLNCTTGEPDRGPGHFLRIRQWGGQLQKGTILYQVWRNDKWLLVTKI